MGAGVTRIFVSHSHAHMALSESLRNELQRRGFDSMFIDFDPVDGIPPGRDWEAELYRALRRCDLVLAIDSPGWRKSRWCFAEMIVARSLGKKVVRVRPADFTARLTGAAAVVQDAQAFTFTDVATAAPLFDELKRLGLGGLRRFRWDPDRSPYPGLSPLHESDAGVFFGRDADVRTVIDLVERSAKYGDKSIVLLIGPSGSGKSSLLRAGVIPQIRLRREWLVVGPLFAATDPALPLDTIETLPSDQRAVFAIDQIDEALSDPHRAATVAESFEECRFSPTRDIAVDRNRTPVASEIG